MTSVWTSSPVLLRIQHFHPVISEVARLKDHSTSIPRVFHQSAHRKSRASRASYPVCCQVIDDELGDCLRDDFAQRSKDSMEAPVLEPKHKIFLSHSGAQKEFVEYLSKALEDRWHFPFYDRRHDSIPKGEQYPGLIIQAAEQCEMLIVVISEDYFVSKWPMIELSAFVKVHEFNNKSKQSNGGPKILPLFYGLSVNDLEDKGQQSRWFKKWEALARDDYKKRISVSDWKYALNVLRSFNGMVYNRDLKEIVAFVDKIVAVVDETIIRDMKWDDSHVQGKLNIYKMIFEKIERLGVSKENHLKVLGIHGVGGIGKTTTCKTLSNELMTEYEGRVCHIEFQSVATRDFTELLRKVVADLTKRSKEGIQGLNEGECKHALRKSLPKHKVFLAIDNVSDEYESIKCARMLLEVVSYHKECLVVVTSRSKSVLEYLGINEDACMEMPEITKLDAMNLFLHHAAHGKEFVEDGDTDNILKCIERCYFSKGDGLGSHYHPLALESLGLLLGYYGKRPLEWVKNLERVRSFGDMSRRNPVFDILRSNFDPLLLSEQSLFMDVGLFYRLCQKVNAFKCIEWLCSVHKEDEDAIILRLEALKRKGLLQHVDSRSGRVSLHDLYYEFAELEARGSFHESTDLKERKWVYVDTGNITDLEREPAGRCWENLIRLAIRQSAAQIGRLEGIKWEYFPNVQILQLDGVRFGEQAVNISRMVGLRSLELTSVSKLGRLEGLEGLKNLTRFIWYGCPSFKTTGFIEGHFPSSLKTLHISGDGVVLRSDILAQCNNLSELLLDGVRADRSLDLSSCGSLESVSLSGIRELETVSGLAASRPSNLHSLEVSHCYDLVAIPGIHHLRGLKRFVTFNCTNWEVPSLEALTNLECLNLHDDIHWLALRVNPCSTAQSLGVIYFRSLVRQNFVGFNRLAMVRLSSNFESTIADELGELPALRSLDLRHCKLLVRLPDLTVSKNLEDLTLVGCDALELHDTDIQMLAELPSLHPVPIGNYGKVRLDFVRRKMLIHACKSSPICYGPRDGGLGWKEHEWEERELPAAPISLKTLAREYEYPRNLFKRQ